MGSFEEYNQMVQIIINYCKNTNKIIYGGYSLNILTGNKIYKEKQRSDIEFFSSDLHQDTIELTNILFDYFKINVESKEALHSGTNKIFVNFNQICDITYIDKEIELFFHDNFCEKKNGINLLKTNVMIIDKFKMISNPNVYSRLDKELKRIKIIMD